MADVPAPIHWARSMMRRALRRFESGRADTPPFETRFDFHIALEPDDLDGGWVAEVVGLPGCLSQGETEAEALHNISDAIAAMVTARIDEQVAEMGRHNRPVRHEHRVQVAL